MMIRRAALVLCFILFLMPLGMTVDRPTEPAEFNFVRLQYNSGRGFDDYGYGRFGSWATDAWEADYKYMWGIDRMTGVRQSKDPHPVPIMSPDLFSILIYTLLKSATCI